jgi:type IV pilus assembly protein PilX
MRTTRQSQKGATLIVAILFLLVITVLGIASWQMGSGEEKMAGLTRDRQLAYEAAEAALREAEYDISGACAPNATCNKRTPSIEKGLGFPTTPADFTTPVTCQADGLCTAQKDRVGRNMGNVPISILRCGTNGPSALCVNGQSTWFGQYTRTSGSPSSYMPGAAGLAAQRLSFAPRYTIQAVCLARDSTGTESCNIRSLYYVITAIGFGQRPNTEVVLQTYYQPE